MTNLFDTRRWAIIFTSLASACAATSPSVQAAAEAEVTAPDMPRCIAQWQSLGRQQGLSKDTLGRVIPSLKYVPRVLELDRRQPEFTSTFGDYLSKRVTDTRIERGQQLRQEKAELLQSLNKKYGIPESILLAFWGLETNFGGYMGNMSTLDSLATLACDARRSDYFTRELMTALELVERHKLDPDAMRGSWAGAMGHTQFMPSNYRQYGLDGDGDGQINLWDSQTDALTSAANFLQRLGWQADARWGREVSLPKNFDYTLADIKRPRALSEWQQLGVRDGRGGALPVADFEAALLVPSGHTGPAFLVYKNFRIIMRWNNSLAYALSVGLLADRIDGAAPLAHPPTADDGKISYQRMKDLQTKLNALGFDAGKPDGIAGSGTRGAIRAFQTSRKMIADGYYSAEVFEALGL